MKRFRGVYPVLYAFFDEDGKLDRNAMAKQVEFCIDAGAHGICVLGLVTEVNRMDATARIALVQMVGELIAGRVPYAVTVGEPTVDQQVSFCHQARDAGASWVILQPPPGAGHSEDDLIAFFGAVASALDMPVAIQNNPVNLATSLSVEGLVRVVRANANVTLLKAEGWSVDIARVIAELDGAIDAFGGHGGIEFLSLLRSGGAGLIPAPDCITLQVRIYDLMSDGSDAAITEARAIHRELLPLIIFMTRNIAGLVYYGKRLFAAQIGVETVHDLPGGAVPSAFGMDEMRRLLLDVRETSARYLGKVAVQAHA